MKKLILISLTLAAASMGCLQTAMISESPSETADPVFAMQTEAPAGAVYEMGSDSTLTPTLSLKGEGKYPSPICAEVIAEDALHLRGGPSEDDLVLTWLLHGDVVRVIDRSRSDWWLVEFNGRTGYARAEYLREETCQ